LPSLFPRALSSLSSPVPGPPRAQGSAGRVAPHRGLEDAFSKQQQLWQKYFISCYQHPQENKYQGPYL